MSDTGEPIPVHVANLLSFDAAEKKFLMRDEATGETYSFAETDVGSGIVAFSTDAKLSFAAEKQAVLKATAPPSTESDKSIEVLVGGDEEAAPEAQDPEIAALSESTSELLKARLQDASRQWEQAERALQYGRRVLLWGPPGTGKSFIGKSRRPKEETTSLYLTMDTAGTEVRGCMMPNESGGFSWVDGPLTTAWRKGHLAIVDEIDSASGDTLTELLKYLDDPESAWTTLMSGEQVTPHEEFQCLCTTNQQPATLPEALLDRFDSVVLIDRPNPKAFKADLWNSNIVRQGALRVTYLRDSPLKTDAGRNVGLRAFRSVDRYTKAGLEVMDAAKVALGTATGEWFARAVKIGGDLTD